MTGWALSYSTGASDARDDRVAEERPAGNDDEGTKRSDEVTQRWDVLPLQMCTRRARDLAVMGATLADGDVKPITEEQVVAPHVCHYALAVMLTAGMYKTSGEWLYDVGLPAKSGIGGGIVTVPPGKGATGTLAPPLDRAGNSVKGQLVAEFLSPRLGIDLLASAPAS